MKKITIVQEYEVTLPPAYEHISKERLVDTLNRMYDVHGKDILKRLSAEEEYVCTKLTEVDGDSVYCEDTKRGQMVVFNSGYDILLDGQPLETTWDVEEKNK